MGLSIHPVPRELRDNPAAQEIARRNGVSIDALWSTMGDQERAAAVDALQRQQQGPQAQAAPEPRQRATRQEEYPPSRAPMTLTRAVGDVVARGDARMLPPGMGPMSVMPDERVRWDYPVPPEGARRGDAPPQAPSGPPPGISNPIIGPEPHDTRNPRAREIVMQRRRDEDRQLREAAAVRRAERDEANSAALAPDPNHEWGRSMLRDAGQVAARTWRPALSVQGAADAVNRTINPVVSYASGGFEFPTSDGQTRWLRDRVDAAVRESGPAAAPVEGQTAPQRRPAPPPEAQEPIEGQTRPRGQGEAPPPAAGPQQRDGRALSFGAFAPGTEGAAQQAVQTVGQTAPATAAALQQGIQRLSVQNAPGQMPSQSQYRRAADDMVDQFVNNWGPREFMHLMEQGRVAEAFAWRDFYESKGAQQQANHFSRAVFAITMGDAPAAIREATAAVAGSEIGDMYEIVPGKSGFLSENDDLFARFTFRNRQTGEEFTQSFSTMEDLVGGLASVASAESTFERKQAAIQQRIEAVMEQQASDEDKLIELTEMFYKDFDDILGASTGQGMSDDEKLEIAQRLAQRTIAGARGAAQSGVGSLGVSQGGRRDPSVPAVAAP